MTGLRVSVNDEDSPESPLEQAELMVAMFQSVDRDSFDVSLTTDEGRVTQAASALGPEALLEQLPRLLQEVEEKDLNVTTVEPKFGIGESANQLVGARMVDQGYEFLFDPGLPNGGNCSLLE